MMKRMTSQYFSIFMYIWWFRKLFVVFFCGKFTKPCRHAKAAKMTSLASIINKKPKILPKRPPIVERIFPLAQTSSLRHWYTGV